MGQGILYEIDHCLQLVKKLEKQLEENRESFSKAASDVLSSPYSDGVESAKDQCRQLRNELNRLRAQELELMMAEEQ